MLMSDVATWVAIAAGFVIGLPALWMLSRGLWPEAYARRVAAARHNVGVSLLLGVVPAFIFVVLMVLGARRLGPVPGLILSAAIIMWGLNGMVGIASLIGERLWPEGAPWKQTRNGGLVVICCALLPVVGWFVLLPAMAVIGMGVNLRCLFMSRRPPPLPAAAPTVAMETSN